eukprot:366000-Chlamydomonas_euryale.AAC.23
MHWPPASCALSANGRPVLLLLHASLANRSMLKKDADKRPSVEELLMAAPIREEVLWAQARARVLQPCVATPTALSLMEAGLDVAGGATPRTPDAVKRESFDQPNVQQASNTVSAHDAPALTSKPPIMLESGGAASFVQEGISHAVTTDGAAAEEGPSTVDVQSGSIRTCDNGANGSVKAPVGVRSGRVLGAGSNRATNTKAGGSGAQQEAPVMAVRAPLHPVASKPAVPIRTARPARPAVAPRAGVQGRAAVPARVPRVASALADASAKDKAHVRVPLDAGSVRSGKQRASPAQGAAMGIASHRRVAATDRHASESVPVLPTRPALPPTAPAAELLAGGPTEQQAVAVAAVPDVEHTEDPCVVPPAASHVAVPASDAAGRKQGMRGTSSSGGSDAVAAMSACVPASKAEQLMYNNELYQVWALTDHCRAAYR